MSVVIVAPQAKLQAPARTPTSTGAAESTGSTAPAVAGADFASLLLGQLAAGADLQAMQPQTDGNNTSGSTEPAPQDAALMLATLGMAPIEQPKTVDIPQSGKADSILTPGIAAKESATSIKTPLDNALKMTRDAQTNGSSSEFILPPTSGAEDKPAKVAATDFSLPAVETPRVGKLADDVQTIGTTSVLPHTPVTALGTEGALKVETPVHDRTWAADFSQKIIWLATNDKQTAQLTLNPPQMGPIEISLNLNKDGASAFFVSQNADVREAIETALPRLREMFADAGIQLGQANVGAESFRQQAGNEEARQGTPRWMADNAILGGDPARGLSGQSIIAQGGKGLVNIFA